MPTVYRDVDFGKDYSGIATTGYKVLDNLGATVIARTTIGVFDLGKGKYGANFTLSTGFIGTVFWDTVSGGDVTALESIDLTAQATGLGTGARTVTITVNDGSNPVQSASVRLTKGVESYIGLTAANGQITFNVDDGTWTVAITRTGYTFAGASLVVATPSVNQTYSMTQTAITPSSPGLTTGYLTAYDEDGIAEAGVEIHCEARQFVDAVGVALDSEVRTEISAANGLVQFTNLFKGASYSFRRGVSEKLYVVTIPSNAGVTYELPAIVGEESTTTTTTTSTTTTTT